MNDELNNLERWYRGETSRSKNASDMMSIERIYRQRKIEIERRMGIVENRFSLKPHVIIGDHPPSNRSYNKASGDYISYLNERMQKQGAVTSKYVTPRAKRLMKIAQQITIET